MSFVLDTNSFTKFMEHFCEFEPLLSWFNNDPAIKLVIGGSKYNDEIRKCNKFLGLVIELKRKRKVFEANKEEVDLLADKVKKYFSPCCDDYHLIALLDISRCYIFVSYDRRADEFIKGWVYSDGKKRHIYRYKKHKKILIRYAQDNLKNGH